MVKLLIKRLDSELPLSGEGMTTMMAQTGDAELLDRMGALSPENVELAWRQCGEAGAALLAGRHLIPEVLPREVFSRKPTLFLVKSWLGGGGKWDKRLCAALTKTGRPELLRFAYENGCPCVYISALRAIRLGSPRLLRACGP